MSSFGRVFRVSTFGESHCKGVGCIVEGCPPGLELTEADIQGQLTRRRPGQSRLTTPRDEKDKVTIMSGTELGKTLGTPIALIVPNENVRPGDYKEMSNVPRPGHADYTYQLKYGVRASSGGGRASARETIGRVAAGAVAEKWLSQQYNTSIVAFVCSIGDISIPQSAMNHPSGRPWTREEVDTVGCLRVLRNPADGNWKRITDAEVADKAERSKQQLALDTANEDLFVKKSKNNEDSEFAYRDSDGNVYTRTGKLVEPTPTESELAPWMSDELIPVRCPHPATAAKMSTLIRTVKSEDDSIGGTVACVCSGVPVGLGEPCFDKLEAMLAHAMLSLPATKGFEFGSGFEGTKLRGSKHNDPFTKDGNNGAPYLSTTSNNAGGILGGISSGQDIYFRVAVKAVSTIGRAQPTANFDGKDTVLEAKGRHDPCVLPRTPPLLECMSALVLADAAMMQRTRRGDSTTAVINGNSWFADPSLKTETEQPPAKKTKTDA